MRPFARAASLTGFPELCGSLGVDPVGLLAQVGLTLLDLEVGDRWLPAAPFARLLQSAADESGCDDFAVRMSEYRTLGSLGPLSLGLREEPDLRSVLHLLVRFEQVYTGVLDMRLTEADGRARAEIWLEFGEPVPVRQVEDLIAANTVGIVRALVREDWFPAAASFAHGPPSDLSAFSRTFGGRPRFGADATALVFAGHDLDAPVVTSDPSVRPYAHQYLESVLPAPEGTALADRVGFVVETLLPLGQCSLESVGLHLGLSPRLLQQRLADDGESFSTVVHATRGRLAERYLSADRFSQTEIAQLLGFAAPSAFSRWFRQQFGRSPSEWRAAVRGEAAPLIPLQARRSSAAATPSPPE